ncbi:redoxin domain-containing protein [Candidatus Poribacteria bacterium]|nr:redoxin domain-containing protein [Candidatus Poribacteria bacterium]
MRKAPELIGGTEWLNTSKPIYIKDLKGKIVLLDFWTYACINCIHVIPDLKKLEAKYPDELVVIGVHSAKFTNEKNLENIRQAILRYGIEHPVVNDSEFRIWRSYGVRAWPTFVVINPDGYVAGTVSGEGNYELLDNVIGALVEEFSKQDKLNTSPLELLLEKHKEPESKLSFPGKILAVQDRLFISDSNHNRIIVADTHGNVIDIIGDGEEDSDDGTFETASFKKPQGLSFFDDQLYVADTENHLIRQCDLKNKIVMTIAGTGKKASPGEDGGKALETPLNSPWDILTLENRSFIAMAGSHQVWVMVLGHVKHYAGSGREGIIDGKLMESQLAQPSGITTDGKKLYIADSESSSIRSIDMDPDGKVETIVGPVGGGLFEFGDVDGKGREVRLQHPLGVVYHKGIIYTADTYNHKIKIINPKKKTSKTYLGEGKPGKADGAKSAFYEPSGLSVMDDKMYIADTNNHAIRAVDLETKEVSTLALFGFEDDAFGVTGLPSETLVYPARSLQSNSKCTLVLNLALPPGYKFTEGAPFEYGIEQCDRDIMVFHESDKMRILDNAPKMPLRITFNTSKTTGGCFIRANLVFNYCFEETGACLIKTIGIQVPVKISKEEKNRQVYVEYKVGPGFSE